MSKPIVAIVGRPNVGKSTFFNKIVGRRVSIVEDTPGVTRDRIYAEAEWNCVHFALIDTGGIEPESQDVILSQMRQQAQVAMDMADVILFIVDGKEGLTTADREVGMMLMRTGKRVILVVNKIDKPTRLPDDFYDFYELGLGEPIPVSAANMLNFGDVLDEVVASFPEGSDTEDDETIKVAVIGKPNVGKSSLVNRILGEERVIVSNVAGTTRDTVEEKVRMGHVLLRLCDTAGIRDTADAVEKIGVDRARAAARQASLALLVLDGSRPLTEADREAMALARQVPNLLVAVNKADLPRAVDIGRLADDFDNVVSLSARSGQGVDVLCDAIQALYPAGEGRPGELLTNARQADAVSRALAAVRSARGALRTGMTPDVVLTDAETALEALGELNGKHIRDDLIQTIFSRFCVGK